VAGSKKALSKIAPQTRIENITKVTFEGKDGKTFVLDGARVWKIKALGNTVYQVHGENSVDLVEYFK
jgi:NACalpha-BTF3-like transcription factor